MMINFFIKVKAFFAHYTPYVKNVIISTWKNLKKKIKRYLPLIVFSPLEQFEVNKTFYIFNFNKYYSTTDITTILYTYFTKIFFNFNSFSETLFIIILYNAFVLYCFFTSSYYYPYTWLQLFFEKIYSEIFKFFIKNAGISNQPIFTSFFVIVISLLQLNIFGVLPFSFTVTSHVIITSFYSFSIFFAINFIAIKRHGLSFFNIFLPKGVPFILSPLVIYIEIISYISRVFSLSIRLFANMMAGHALLSIFTSFIFNAIFTNGFSIMLSITGILLIFSIILIELIIAFLQVYVFSTLIALYIKDIHNVDHLFMWKYLFKQSDKCSIYKTNKTISFFSLFSYASDSIFKQIIFTFLFILFCIILFFSILFFTASFTLVERKLMALYQRREGPDKTGFEGIGQPIADGIKLIKKETIWPKSNSSQFTFFTAPIISLTVSLSLWSLIPFSSHSSFVNSEISLLFFLAFSSLSSYGIIYAGWSSNNKYALMGSFRAVAQFISYEIIFSIIFMPIALITESVNFISIVKYQINNGWFVFYLIPFAIIFVIVALAETNRTPFDLPEAEAELVSGFNVEYSSLLFASFFLAEYSSMGLISSIFVICFLGGWSIFKFPFFTSKSIAISSPANDFTTFDFSFFGLFEIIVFSIKVITCCFIFILIRASLPRKRFDQLIHLCWKILFPFIFSITILCLSLYVSFSYFICGYNEHYKVIRQFSKTTRVVTSLGKVPLKKALDPRFRNEFINFLLDFFNAEESFNIELQYTFNLKKKCNIEVI